jgi:hypothetical protein
MSRHRRTADDFVRDMKAKQQHSNLGDIDRRTSEAVTPEQAGAWRGNRPKLLAMKGRGINISDTNSR